MSKPILALTMGDPAGIGPEICILSLLRDETYQRVRPFIIGDLDRLQQAAQLLERAGRFQDHAPILNPIVDPKEASYGPSVINVLDLNNVPSHLPWGEIQAQAGQSAFDYLKKAVELALDGVIEGICTAPIHKEAWKLAHIPFPGHTEALASLSDCDQSAMMLVNQKLRVVHVTTHVSLQDAVRMATKEKVLERILLTAQSLQRFGIPAPRIAVAGLNPHAGEGGLFGDEEITQLIPAVESAKALGLTVTGPLPPDSVFSRAANGEFDVVIAQYHDQGHIAIKMLGFDTGINVTLGLPILRTSVDHGTAFDIAGRGLAREHSMIAAIHVAADFLAVGKDA